MLRFARTLLNSASSIRSFSTQAKKGIPAIAFDIDGVLLKDGHVIGNSVNAIRSVTSTTDGGLHPVGIPYIFLTNGGGVPEAKRAQQLESIFGVKVRPEQDDLVCVVGMHDVKEVAEMYGFNNLITPAEIRTAFPTLTPHTRYDHEVPGLALPSTPSTASNFTKFRTAHAANEEAHALLSRVAAVLIMHDPRDWYVDLQVVLDILVTGREMNFLYQQEQTRLALQKAKVEETGLPSADPLAYLASDAEAAMVQATSGCGNCGSSSCGGGSCSGGGCSGGGCGCGSGKRKQEIPHTPLYFSNPDLLYSNSYRLPRLAQGAFAVCLNHLYLGITGSELKPRTYGKPTTNTYKYADKLLRAELKRLYPDNDAEIAMTYGIGDNPSADIHGANQAGDHWTSVFVRTGTIAPSNDPRKIPKMDLENVDVAVRTILEKHA